MKIIKILVAIFSISLFVGCGSDASTNDETTSKTVDVKEYMYDKLYTDDTEGNIRHHSYENDYYADIDNGRMNWQFKSNGDVWFYDSRISDLGRGTTIPFPSIFQLDALYSPSNEHYDIQMAIENDNLAILVRVYNGSDIIVDAEYYFNKGNGLYKIIFNGGIIRD